MNPINIGYASAAAAAAGSGHFPDGWAGQPAVFQPPAGNLSVPAEMVQDAVMRMFQMNQMSQAYGGGDRGAINPFFRMQYPFPMPASHAAGSLGAPNPTMPPAPIPDNKPALELLLAAANPEIYVKLLLDHHVRALGGVRQTTSTPTAHLHSTPMWMAQNQQPQAPMVFAPPPSHSTTTARELYQNASSPNNIDQGDRASTPPYHSSTAQKSTQGIHAGKGQNQHQKVRDWDEWVLELGTKARNSYAKKFELTWTEKKQLIFAAKLHKQRKAQRKYRTRLEDSMIVTRGSQSPSQSKLLNTPPVTPTPTSPPAAPATATAISPTTEVSASSQSLESTQPVNLKHAPASTSPAITDQTNSESSAQVSALKIANGFVTM